MPSSECGIYTGPLLTIKPMSILYVIIESRFKAKAGGITPLKIPDPPTVPQVQPDMLV